MPEASSPLPISIVREVRDTCQCLAAQRRARLLARRFDAVFQPLNINNGQFSLLVALAAPKPWRMGPLAELLAMDRTTLTSLLVTLKRRKLVKMMPDKTDKRARLVTLSAAGSAVVAKAVPLWREEHEKVAREI